MAKKAGLNLKEYSVKELLGMFAEYNPRKMTPEQENGLRASLDKFGYVQNIIVNKRTGNLVSGHQRVKLLAEEGYDVVDVHEVDLSEEDEKKLNVLMNSYTISGNFTDGLNKILDEILDNDTELFDLTNMSLLYTGDSDDILSTDDSSQEKEIVRGMDLLPYESYDAILVVFKRRDNFMFISGKLNLDKKVVISSPSVKKKKLGYTRAVDGAKLVSLVTGGKDLQRDEYTFDL